MLCGGCNPDNIFRRFKVVEFPTSFVNLSTIQDLDVEIDLNTSAYLKTMCDGHLVKFEDACKVSASHRAFQMIQIDNHTIKIMFRPLSECISKALKSKMHCDNRFVFDLRLIKVDGTRCCNNELHSEVGRYYISGQYEYCKITHSPNIVSFGDVVMRSKVTKIIRIRNESKFIAAKINYVRVTGFEVIPQNFTIAPNSSKRITVSIKPTCLKMGNTLVFQIRNPYETINDMTTNGCLKSNNNFISYTVKTTLNVICDLKSSRMQIAVESLHKLYDQNPLYTFIDEELIKRNERKRKALRFLEQSKSSHVKKPIIVKPTGKEICYSDSTISMSDNGLNFCEVYCKYITAYDLFDVLLMPFTIDFGKIGLNTYGERVLMVKNKTRYDITINLSEDLRVVYTKEKFRIFKLDMKPLSESAIIIFCKGYTIGSYQGTFEYNIDNKYYLKHPYIFEVSNPELLILERNLKFGMVTNESFITSVPVRIINNFNIAVEFKWGELNSDTPFEIIPSSGLIPENTCKICDILYVCKATKTKTHEIHFISKGCTTVTALELNIITRKLSIKFLQPTVIFKDVALNLKTMQKVKLENSSREIALFYVVEPLIPGVTITPMSGIIRPKSVITFDILVKIACILDFSFEIYIKINNKESISLPISGNVVEPKIIINPKNIYMARVPCGMITYVPLTIQNISSIKTLVEVLDTGDENIFNVYLAQGNEKQRVYDFIIDAGQSKTVFIKVYDIFRREYEMYIPFKINGLLGPPDQNTGSTDLQHYIGPYELQYENNSKVRVKNINKDISYCRIIGVITVSWIEFSVDKFEIDYEPNGANRIDFTMTNVSKYHLQLTIFTSKLAPYFTLNIHTEASQSIAKEANIKFDLHPNDVAELSVIFHPKGHGRFVSTALLYLDRYLSLPYYNLTFIGKRQTPIMMSKIQRLVFPPCLVGTEIEREITLKMEGDTNIDALTCSSKEEQNLNVKFISCNTIQEEEQYYTFITVKIKVCCRTTYARNITLSFHHECGSSCDVEVVFCSTFCPLTLHVQHVVKPENNPYPYYPLESQIQLYEYLECCCQFLEKWMFQQGFRRDLYPVIPDTFHVISSAISSPAGVKSKGINVSYLSFVRRIAGPLMKHVQKISIQGVDESFKYVKEIHDTYKEITNLLASRGANLWILQPRFLLSYEQFVIYNEHVANKCNADIILTQELLADVNLYNRLNKQCWLDFILQTYKVFILDSCFFECICVSSQPQDIIKVLVDWYNDQILTAHSKIREENKPAKVIMNITTDMSDGIALISAFLNHCPFLEKHFSSFCEVNENDPDGSIISNACLIIEAMNLLKLYFPLSSKELLKPNFLQMLFLSVHLYLTLPMFKSKEEIKFNPPLLRSSSRQLSICPSSQETLIFTYTTLNNTRNNFNVEKSSSSDNGKKMFLNVKYTANFVEKFECILLIHGYNKTRIFDTYIIFNLVGSIGVLNPVRKCKVTGPLYRPIKVDVLVNSPFIFDAMFEMSLTDFEPTIPVKFEIETQPRFYLRRLNLIDREIYLSAMPKESGPDVPEHKLNLQLICLSTLMGNTWIWFRSEIGEFFIRVTTQPRWDLAIDTLQVKVDTWPMEPCSCGESCECYRTTILLIPHRNELMLKSLRHALLENASNTMMQVFDQLIESTTGKIILEMLLTEGGTNVSEVKHILRSQNTYRISSRALLPRLDRVTLSHHTDDVLALPITIPPHDKSEKYSVTFTSDCGMDIRTYRILFIEKSSTVGRNSC